MFFFQNFSSSSSSSSGILVYKKQERFLHVFVTTEKILTSENGFVIMRKQSHSKFPYKYYHWNTCSELITSGAAIEIQNLLFTHQFETDIISCADILCRQVSVRILSLILEVIRSFSCDCSWCFSLFLWISFGEARVGKFRLGNQELEISFGLPRVRKFRSGY